MCKKHLFTAFLLLSAFASFGQYTPGSHVVVNDAVAPAQPTPLDARTMFYDGTNFLYRAYNGTAEVLTYLNTTASRTGNFIMVVDSGGSLQGNGTYIGGYNTFYMFKDSTTAGGLVKMNLFGTGAGTCSTCLLIANNLSDLASLSTALVNLGLNNVNNTSDATKNAATVTLTNHTISGAANTLTNIPNSALNNNSIGLTLTSTGTTPQVTTTPAALGTSLVVTFPWTNGTDSGLLKGTDWVAFHNKNDSATISNDSLYNWVNGTPTLQSVIAGTGGVNSVNGTNASLLFSPSTGNVLGQVNPAYSFTWTGQHIFSSFSPIFSTLTTPGGIFYGSNSSGQLSQSGAGTTGQILESPGDGTAPIFFTPGPMTVEGWLGYTPLSASLGSTQIYVGNAMNTAQAVNLSGAATLSNTGVLSLNLTNNASTLGQPSVATGVLNIDTLRYGRIFNVVDYGADPTGVADATASIQATVNIAAASGNSTVWFPRGKYLIAGPVLSGCNCQIQIPPDSIARNLINVNFEGEGQISPSNGNLQTPFANVVIGTMGVTLYSTYAGTASTTTAGTAIFGSVSPSTTFFNVNTASFHHLFLMMKYNPNGSGPEIGGICGKYLIGLVADDIAVGPDTSGNSFVTPTRNVSGIETPENSGGATYPIYNCSVFGMRWGFIFGEHVVGNALSAAECWYGYGIKTAYHGSEYPRIGSFWNVNAVAWYPFASHTGDAANCWFIIHELDIEYGTGNAGYWNSVYSVNDSLNVFKGNINYISVTQSVGNDNSTYAVNGATGVISTALGSSPVSAAAGSDTYLQYNNSGSLGASANYVIDKSNPVITVGGGTPLFNINAVGASSAGGTFGYYGRNTTSTGQTISVLENDRGSLASYTDLIHGGSGSSALGALFGQTRVDKTFLIHAGASGLGMWLGTINAEPLGFGTNNAEAMLISAAGAVKYDFYGSGTHSGTAAYCAAFDASGNLIEVACGSGVTTVGTFSGSSITNGASISTNTITFGPADATNPGMVTTGTQTIAGSKTFTGNNVFSGSQTSISGIFGYPGTPGIAAGAGAGTSPSLTIVGTNICGQIILTPGVTPTGTNAVVATITFVNGFGATAAPVVMLTPGNAATALLSGVTMVYTTNPNLTSWTINSGTTALTTGTQYFWNYQVMAF